MRIRNKLFNSFKENSKRYGFWIELAVLSCFLVAFAPVSHWFASYTFSENRVFHSLITLIIAVALLFRNENPKIQNELNINTSCQKSLFITCILILVFFLGNFILQWIQFDKSILSTILDLSLISAMTMSVTSLVFFIFGTQIERIAFSSSKCLILFFFISLFMIQLDWPLRALAAKWSVLAIEILGQNASVFITNLEENISGIIIQYSGRHFNVASECNGFGIILNGALISILLSAYRQHSLFETGVQIIAALFIGFVMNIMRIITIIFLAPIFFSHYDLIHETLGSFYYWGSFFITWYLLKGPIFKKNPAES